MIRLDEFLKQRDEAGRDFWKVGGWILLVVASALIPLGVAVRPMWDKPPLNQEEETNRLLLSFAWVLGPPIFLILLAYLRSTRQEPEKKSKPKTFRCPDCKTPFHTILPSLKPIMVGSGRCVQCGIRVIDRETDAPETDPSLLLDEETFGISVDTHNRIKKKMRRFILQSFGISFLLICLGYPQLMDWINAIEKDEKGARELLKAVWVTLPVVCLLGWYLGFARKVYRRTRIGCPFCKKDLKEIGGQVLAHRHCGCCGKRVLPEKSLEESNDLPFPDEAAFRFAKRQFLYRLIAIGTFSLVVTLCFRVFLDEQYGKLWQEEAMKFEKTEDEARKTTQETIGGYSILLGGFVFLVSYGLYYKRDKFRLRCRKCGWNLFFVDTCVLTTGCCSYCGT